MVAGRVSLEAQNFRGKRMQEVLPTVRILHGKKEMVKDSYSCGPSSSIPAINSATPKGLLMMDSSPSAPSPNLSAKSQMACVQLSTLSGSL